MNRDFHTVLLWDTSTCVCVGTCRDSDDILSWSHAARGTDCIIRGRSFSLYKVGEKVKNKWELYGDFKKAEVNLEDMTSSGQKKAAEQLHDLR